MLVGRERTVETTSTRFQRLTSEILISQKVEPASPPSPSLAPCSLPCSLPTSSIPWQITGLEFRKFAKSFRANGLRRFGPVCGVVLYRACDCEPNFPPSPKESDDENRETAHVWATRPVGPIL